MRIFLITAFPEVFQGPFNESIIKRAIDRKNVEIHFIYLRKFTDDRHNTIDDTEFGGSFGMVYKVDPISRALKEIREKNELKKPRVILMTARGEVFNQKKAFEFSREEDLIFICGHYKDMDFRIDESFVTDRISIGDYILTGGETAAITVTDAIIRLLPGVVGNKDSVRTDSFVSGLLDCPRYTRPADYEGWKVPEVLLSGHHRNIEKWRKYQSIKLTRERRPDLWSRYESSREDLQLIEEFENGGSSNERN